MSKQKRAKRQQARQASLAQKRLLTWASLLGAFILISLIVWLALPKNNAPAPAVNRLELDPVLGNPTAPIRVVEYGAYGCEACRAWHEAEIIEQLLREFPNQVQFIYRDMPIIIPAWSQEMAEVAQCALDQSNEAFWLMHNALFSQTLQGRTSQNEALSLGASLGLDLPALRTCVEAHTHYETVRYDMNRPEARSVRGTPTWFVNGQLIFNASPTILRQTILSELAKLGS